MQSWNIRKSFSCFMKLGINLESDRLLAFFHMPQMIHIRCRSPEKGFWFYFDFSRSLYKNAFLKLFILTCFRLISFNIRWDSSRANECRSECAKMTMSLFPYTPFMNKHNTCTPREENSENEWGEGRRLREKDGLWMGLQKGYLQFLLSSSAFQNTFSRAKIN